MKITGIAAVSSVGSPLPISLNGNSYCHSHNLDDADHGYMKILSPLVKESNLFRNCTLSFSSDAFICTSTIQHLNISI
jgi:hypothetical protein